MEYWKSQDISLVTETCSLWDQEETWNFQDRDQDPYKCSQDQNKVLRLHHCKKFQQTCRINKVVEFVDLKELQSFMVQHFFMVNLVVDMHGTNNSTAMKFFPTTTSRSIKGERAVNYINFVPIDIVPLIELISSNLFIIFATDLEET